MRGFRYRRFGRPNRSSTTLRVALSAEAGVGGVAAGDPGKDGSAGGEEDLRAALGLLLEAIVAAIPARDTGDDPDEACQRDLDNVLADPRAPLSGLHTRLFIVARRAEMRGDVVWADRLGEVASLCLDYPYVHDATATQAFMARCRDTALALAPLSANSRHVVTLGIFAAGVDVNHARTIGAAAAG